MPADSSPADAAAALGLPHPGELPDPSAAGASRYRAPGLLRDLRLLDALELTGTTELAGRWLAVSQPTVSRRCRRLASEFGITLMARQAKRCPQGNTMSLRQLRLAARWHRFEAGVMALATDPLHAGLLHGIEGLLACPHRFRAGHHWLDLVRDGVIDAALVSSLELETGMETCPQRRWGDADRWPLGEPETLHLGQWPLQLAAAARHSLDPLRLLVPPEEQAAGLRALLAGRGLMVACAPEALHSLAAWRRQMAEQQLAAMVPAALLAPGSALEGLWPLPGPCALREHLWLLLPQGWQTVPVLRHGVESLRIRALRAGAVLPEAPGDDQEHPAAAS